MKPFVLILFAASIVASHTTMANDWDIYGKWETSYSYQTDKQNLNLNSRIMADKAHANGSYQWHLQANYLRTDGALSPVPSNHYQLSSLASHHDSNNQRLSLTVDRLNTAIFTDRSTWVIGRQAISLGQSLLFTPLSLGNKLSVPSLDTEYAPGVDAVSADIWLDNGNLQLVAAFGSNDTEQTVNWQGSALLSRYTTHINNLEWAWQLGKISQAHQAGTGISGDDDGIAYRLELAYTEPQASSLHGNGFTTAVAGIGLQPNDELHIEIEYLHNGGADSALRQARLQAGMIASLNESLLALSASYQINPLLIAQATHFKALTDKSQFTQLGVSYSISDNSNIDFNSILYNGTTSSEFGAQTDTHTLTYRSYF